MPEDGFYMNLFAEGFLKCTSHLCCKWFKGEGFASPIGLRYCDEECYKKFIEEIEHSIGRIKESGLEESC